MNGDIDMKKEWHKPEIEEIQLNKTMGGALGTTDGPSSGTTLGS